MRPDWHWKLLDSKPQNDLNIFFSAELSEFLFGLEWLGGENTWKKSKRKLSAGTFAMRLQTIWAILVAVERTAVTEKETRLLAELFSFKKLLIGENYRYTKYPPLDKSRVRKKLTLMAAKGSWFRWILITAWFIECATYNLLRGALRVFLLGKMGSQQ